MLTCLELMVSAIKFAIHAKLDSFSVACIFAMCHICIYFGYVDYKSMLPKIKCPFLPSSQVLKTATSALVTCHAGMGDAIELRTIAME